MPLRAPGELDRALAAGSLEDLQDIRDSIASRVADIRAHLEALKPLEDNPGDALPRALCPVRTSISRLVPAVSLIRHETRGLISPPPFSNHHLREFHTELGVLNRRIGACVPPY